MFPSERLDLAQRYADLLASEGVLRGLIGPREAPRLWSRHLLNSAVLEEQVPSGVRVADIGSGAGLPGVPLAIARPDLSVTLVEPLLRRATFLEEVVEELGLDQVTVIRARGEDLHGSDAVAPGFDVVTSRAVSSMAQLVDWCMPLTAPTGVVLALKGVSAGDEITAARTSLRAWGCATPEVLELGRDRLSETTFAVRVAWGDPSSVGWPPRRQAAGQGRQGRRRR
ncbi:16S rRNA (guanine(527)-N(7))-methyltransferase RsmG [Nocardioides rubriscoriae]|uniref:16S rRNA (guanine(527)-N(7))-methyltransferase RsmG n=1 Tax=Nocardioides rubriscoriae TaxID=642762 RepID=UPI001FE60BB9|nr:16S rRNA (guanine(527)-N(7))-methyltransferase RsmG [Nocardioides rubriscoriae]